MADDTRYAYAVGRIRALETGLLNKSQFEGLIAARNAEEALRTLADTDYGSFLSEREEARDFEIALNEELKNALHLVSDLSRDRELTDIFRLRYDFHNLKVLLKIKYFSNQLPNTPLLPLMNIGLLKAAKLKKIVEGDDYRELPRELRTAAEKAIKAFEETQAAQQIDIILDREMSIIISLRTRDNGHPFLREYFRMDFDLINIRSFLRTKETGRERTFFEEVFLEGGTLKKSWFLKPSGESVNNFASLLSPTPYGGLVSAGIKYRQENHSWSELERQSDNYLLSYLRRAKYVVFGLEPVIAYLLVRENEIKMIRMIIVGKFNGVPENLLRGRLRNIY